MNKLLHLPLKSQWYLMIESGIKKEEYREINDYWCKRLLEKPLQYYVPFGDVNKANPNISFRYFDVARLRYGYTKKFMDFPKPAIRIGRGNPDWGAPTDRDVFIISLNKK